MRASLDVVARDDIEVRALAFARQAHAGQVRKYTGEPYINHCEAVAELVRSVPGHTPEMVAAALLHDTIEDTGTTRDQIAAEFGEVVAALVMELTDQIPKSSGNRATRKRLEAERLATVSLAAKNIKLADLIDNSRTIVPRDPGFARVYLKEKARILKLFDGCGCDPELMHRAVTVTRWAIEELGVCASL